MKRLVVVLFSFLVMTQTGCGLLIAGVVMGGMAAKKKVARDDMIKKLKVANDGAEQALRQGKLRLAMKRFRTGQGYAYGYFQKNEGGISFSQKAGRTNYRKFSLEYREVTRTARGMIKIYLKQKKLSEAAALAVTMIPSGDTDVLRRARVAKAAIMAVKTAPHMFKGKRLEWHGEVVDAQHHPGKDVTKLSIVPYGWQTRQVGMRPQKWYDNQLKIWRTRYVPTYRTFKVPQMGKSFNVSMKGFNELVMPGRAISIIGKVKSRRRRMFLADAVPTTILKSPGGPVLWHAGHTVP